MDNSQVIYRGFDNEFEYSYDCGDCRKNFIKVEGGSFRTINSEEKGISMGIFKADSRSTMATISSYCICQSDTIMVKSKSYPTIEIPRPEIFLGGINITDHSIYDQNVDVDSTGIIAKYTSHPSIAHVKFLILEHTVTLNDQEQKLSHGISEKLNSIFKNMTIGEQLTIDNLILWYPNNKKEKIYLDRKFTKISSSSILQFNLK
jgi:hypothetical protein